MEKAVSVAKENFGAIRTGRAHPGMFSKVVVDYYGAPTPLNQLAGFTVADARMIIISPYDKGSLRSIEKAIRDSDLGVNPTDDGAVIRVTVPQLTEERRRDYIKLARHEAEETRVSIRNIRRHAKEALDKLQKDGEAGEDDVRRAEKELDELTHKYVTQVDDLLKHKESELLEV
jgi:ribosome recycling factor